MVSPQTASRALCDALREEVGAPLRVLMTGEGEVLLVVDDTAVATLAACLYVPADRTAVLDALWPRVQELAANVAAALGPIAPEPEQQAIWDDLLSILQVSDVLPPEHCCRLLCRHAASMPAALLPLALEVVRDAFDDDERAKQKARQALATPIDDPALRQAVLDGLRAVKADVFAA